MQRPRTHPAPDQHYRTAIGKALAVQACRQQFNWNSKSVAVGSRVGVMQNIPVMQVIEDRMQKHIMAL